MAFIHWLDEIDYMDDNYKAYKISKRTKSELQ